MCVYACGGEIVIDGRKDREGVLAGEKERQRRRDEVEKSKIMDMTAYLVFEFLRSFGIVGQRPLEDNREARPFSSVDLAVSTSLQPLDLGNVGKVDLAV